MPRRTVTFDLGADIGSLDELAVEEAWNSWTTALALEGLRPADMAFRSTETSATFRAFSKDLEDEAEHFALDFDITGLGALSGVAVGALTMAMGFGYWKFILGILGGPELLS